MNQCDGRNDRWKREWPLRPPRPTGQEVHCLVLYRSDREDGVAASNALAERPCVGNHTDTSRRADPFSARFTLQRVECAVFQP